MIYSESFFEASGSIEVYSRFVITANPDSKNTNISMATVSKSNPNGDIKPPNNVASPIWADRGFKPTSTAEVTPSNVNIAWIPIIIKK